MKIFSFFRSPKYQRFEYTPRHYDPIKDELDTRLNRKKTRTSGMTEEDRNYSSIRETFRRKQKVNRSASMLQLIIFLMLIITIGGWILYGNDFFYYFFLPLLVPAYLYLRFKKKIR